MEYNIQSSLSCLKIRANNFEFNYIESSPGSLKECILEVMKPFDSEREQRKIVFEIKENRNIPFKFFFERKIYTEILFFLF